MEDASHTTLSRHFASTELIKSNWKRDFIVEKITVIYHYFLYFEVILGKAENFIDKVEQDFCN